MKRLNICVLWVMMLCAVLILGRDASAAGQQDERAEAQGAPAAAPAARIQFPELVHDFGKALQNSILKHTFTFKNTGNGVLMIEKVKAG